MIRSVTGVVSKHELLVRISITARKALNRLLSFRPGSLLSEDMKYQLYFYRSYLPELYRRHVKRNQKNCLFCSRLVKSGCHRYCLKCSAGTYIKCCPPLPGLLYAVPVHADDEDALPVPWYFKKTCSGFKRLPLYRYWRNLYSVFPSIAMNNYEALEGLERGLSSGTRPCHICATVDYGLYRRCMSQPDFNAASPCTRIANELKKAYMSRNAGTPEVSRSAV
ncbi:MAG TPA: hypothetical protein PK127_00470 [Clostridiales bacterium]|nr:hypothetical protein [Clostridiales bacterium]HPV00940.1 hypothetical protein [Clostridiales bacterium]